MQSFDVLVIGTGGIGSAAAFHLAQQGLRVCGLDRAIWRGARGVAVSSAICTAADPAAAAASLCRALPVAAALTAP